MATGSIFRRKSCVIITGASKGLGKSIALHFATKFPTSSVFILLARNLTALENVKQQIDSHPQSPTVLVSVFDQGHIDLSERLVILDKILKDNGIDPEDFEQAVIFHNAGTLGDNSKFIRELSDTCLVQTNFNVNLTGMILLNSNFLRIFSDESKSRIVINISSLTAVTPFASMSLYCTGKAARDMFFRVLALEEPSIRVLSYAPGPCKTDMQRKCRENTGDLGVKKIFQEIHDEGKTLDCDTSVAKLTNLLQKDNFESGAHIDYFDDLGGHVAIRKSESLRTSLSQA